MSEKILNSMFDKLQYGYFFFDLYKHMILYYLNNNYNIWIDFRKTLPNKN